MSPLSIAKSRNPKSATPKKGSAKSNATSRRKVTSAAATPKTPLKADEPKVERVTKQECVLTLLSQPEGASIEEMMQATDCAHAPSIYPAALAQLNSINHRSGDLRPAGAATRRRPRSRGRRKDLSSRL